MSETRALPEPIELAMGFDDRYAPHAAVAIRSIVATSPAAHLRFTVLYEGVSDARRKQVESVAPDAEFRWIDVGGLGIPDYSSREHFSRAILFRLGLESAAPEKCRKILYIDTDVICTRDIRELWETDMGGRPLAAVEDSYVDPDAFAQVWSVEPNQASYFNSGVLLIDIEAVRREKGFQRAIDFVAQHAADVRFADQDALNFVFWGRWTRLDAIWNVQRHMVIPSLSAGLAPRLRLNAKAPRIVHFTGPHKPWIFASYHPWAWLYWRVLLKTCFATEVRELSGVGHLGATRLFIRWLLNPGRFTIR